MMAVHEQISEDVIPRRKSLRALIKSRRIVFKNGVRLSAVATRRENKFPNGEHSTLGYLVLQTRSPCIL